MSMVVDIMQSVHRAVKTGRRPSRIIMNEGSMSRLAGALRRADRDRRNMRVVAVQNKPKILNPRSQHLEQLHPTAWVYDDKDVSLKIPLAIADDVADGRFLMEFSEKPLPQKVKIPKDYPSAPRDVPFVE